MEEPTAYSGVDRRKYVDTATCLERQQTIAHSMEASAKIFETEIKSVKTSLTEMAIDIKDQRETVQQLHDQLLVGNGREAIKVQVAQNTAFRKGLEQEKSLLKRARLGIWAAVVAAVVSGIFTIWAAVVGRWP